MVNARKLAFAPFAPPAKGVLIVFCEDGIKLGPATRKVLALAGDLDMSPIKLPVASGRHAAMKSLAMCTSLGADTPAAAATAR